MSAKINFFVMSAIFFAQNPDNPQWLFLVKLYLVHLEFRKSKKEIFDINDFTVFNDYLADQHETVLTDTHVVLQ